MARGLVEEIRTHVIAKHVRPAKEKRAAAAAPAGGATPAAPAHTLTLVAGDIHAEMGLANRMPAVCCALDRGDFAKRAGVTLLARSGPAQGSTASWTFRIDG